MPSTTLSNINGLTTLDINRGYPSKSITDTVINGFFSVDKQWTVLYWNKAAEKLLGVAATTIVGKNLWDQFAAILPLEFYTVYQNAFTQEAPVHFEEYWGEMGAWFDVITYYCDGVLSVSFKSSNQSVHPDFPKSPDNRLQIVNELYRFVTEVTNDCLWEWNFQSSEIFWIDGGHRKTFGYKIENALIPQSFWEACVHPDDKERILTGIKKVAKGGSGCLWEEEYRFRKSNGEYAYVHDRGHVIGNTEDQSSRMIGATQDITSRKLLEIKLLESERDLSNARLTQVREVTNAVLLAEESERETIGRELYNNLNQVLVAARIQIELAKKSEDFRTTRLDNASGYILDVITDIRRISKYLITPTMVMGLSDSIKHLIENINLHEKIKIEFHENGFRNITLDEKMQMDIFGIIRDQLNSIVSSAKASNISIVLTKEENEIILLIEQDGGGDDILKVMTSLGTIKMRTLKAWDNASVMVTSKPDEGYELKIILPFNSEHQPDS